MIKATFTAISALALVSGLGTAAVAGEVTGTGQPVDAQGRSICKYSGLNDGNLPPGRTQSFGQNVVHDYPAHDPVDPTSFDPDDTFNRHPGWFCNHNNFDASGL